MIHQGPTGKGVKRVKLYPEQARVGTLTLLAESQVGRNEPRGNPPAKRDDCHNRMRLTGLLGPSATSPPSSRGLGHHPFKVKIAGSNPAGGTSTEVMSDE